MTKVLDVVRKDKNVENSYQSLDKLNFTWAKFCMARENYGR